MIIFTWPFIGRLLCKILQVKISGPSREEMFASLVKSQKDGMCWFLNFTISSKYFKTWREEIVIEGKEATIYLQKWHQLRDNPINIKAYTINHSNVNYARIGAHVRSILCRWYLSFAYNPEKKQSTHPYFYFKKLIEWKEARYCF